MDRALVLCPKQHEGGLGAATTNQQQNPITQKYKHDRPDLNDYMSRYPTPSWVNVPYARNRLGIGAEGTPACVSNSRIAGNPDTNGTSVQCYAKRRARCNRSWHGKMRHAWLRFTDTLDNYSVFACLYMYIHVQNSNIIPVHISCDRTVYGGMDNICIYIYIYTLVYAYCYNMYIYKYIYRERQGTRSRTENNRRWTQRREGYALAFDMNMSAMWTLSLALKRWTYALRPWTCIQGVGLAFRHKARTLMSYNKAGIFCGAWTSG